MCTCIINWYSSLTINESFFSTELFLKPSVLLKLSQTQLLGSYTILSAYNKVKNCLTKQRKEIFSRTRKIIKIM